MEQWITTKYLVKCSHKRGGADTGDSVERKNYLRELEIEIMKMLSDIID